MVTYPDEALGRLVDQLEAGERGASEADRELLLAFDRRMALLSSEYGAQRREKLLRHCTLLSEAEGVDLRAALAERAPAEDAVRWIHDEHPAEQTQETNKDYRIALRMFGKRVLESSDDGLPIPEGVATDDDGVPETLAWISTTTSRNYDPSPDPAEMLDWEDDVRPMIDATMNARDAALIATAFDAGPRAGELLDLRVGDVSDHTHGLQITVDGKKGQRSITLITAVPYLNRWLDEHPTGEATAALWCSLRDGSEITYQMARKIPRQAAGHAGVDKPVTFTNFRKSSASFLASRGVNQAVLEDHHGWTRGSKAAARYISVFSEASDRELARAHGVDVEDDDEPDPIAAVTCSRCGRETPRSEDFCMWCHQAVEYGAASDLEATQDEHRRALLGLAKDNPELLDRLEDLEPLVEALGGDVAVIETAREFVDATDVD